ncbi:hypothetical protein C8R45DRAFT_947473 [Mycena sanguinolenta]|nr:hypothetical protein C8R45DRAFT_947473 [Mycena sanguinolenta]
MTELALLFCCCVLLPNAHGTIAAPQSAGSRLVSRAAPPTCHSESKHQAVGTIYARFAGRLAGGGKSRERCSPVFNPPARLNVHYIFPTGAAGAADSSYSSSSTPNSKARLCEQRQPSSNRDIDFRAVFS